MAKVMLATGLIVGYGYVIEMFIAWYSGNPFELAILKSRATGPYWPLWWSLILCNIILVQLLWIKKVRSSPVILFCVSIIVNIGMWLERFVIVVTSLSRDFLPSSWDIYRGTVWDWTLFIGTIGFFLSLMFLFIRLLPMISIFEVRTLVPAKRGNLPPTVEEEAR
jgi:molybdopterin-containing oxidoreductase family membrane subunit